jgi:hypothetical protein
VYEMHQRIKPTAPDSGKGDVFEVVHDDGLGEGLCQAGDDVAVWVSKMRLMSPIFKRRGGPGCQWGGAWASNILLASPTCATNLRRGSGLASLRRGQIGTLA